MSERWTPHGYQIKAVKWLLSHAGAGLFLDPGLGKTSINLAAMTVLKQEQELRNGALVVCELTPLYNVWDKQNPESEPAKWADFHPLKFEMLHGDGKPNALRRKADVYLINPEGLPWLFSTIKPGRFDLLDIDESTTFKHANTQRFGLLRPWLPTFRRRWINTGTPSPNGLLDLFGQIYVLDLGNALGAYITHYRRRFFLPTGYGGYSWVLKGEDVGTAKPDQETGLTPDQERTADEIHERIAPLVLRMDEKDYLKLPPIHGSLAHGRREPGIIKVQMPRDAYRKFATLEEQFFLELEDGVVTSANAAVRHGKLRQAANGGIYLDRPEDADAEWSRGQRKWAKLHDAKTQAVVDFLDEAGMATVIAVEFHHDLERLRQAASLRNVLAIGEGSGAKGKREDALILADWNAGRLRTMVVNPASFAKGSNAQRGGDALLWHSIIWNFEHYDQLIRRFWRQGRKKPFYVRHIVCEGTHDAAMLAALGSKNRTQRSLLDALRAHSQKRRRARR